MSDIESPLWSEIDASNISPAPDGYPAQSSPLIVYSNGRAEMAALKRWWNRVNPTVTSGGSANAQTLTYSVAPTEGYKTGQTFTFVAGFSNSGACTLNVNGLGAKAVQLNGAALAAGAIIAGSITQCIYDGTQFQLTLAGSGAYLLLSGGTLTGNLTIAPAASGAILTLSKAASGQQSYIQGQMAGATRWSVVLGNNAAESGSNVGSDFYISRYTDAGTVIDAPLSINRASAAATFIGALTANSLATSGGIGLSTTVANGAFRNVTGLTSGSVRWQMLFGDAVAESGGNAGSNFVLNAFSDAAGYLGQAFNVARSSRVVTFAVAIVNGPSDRSLKENIQPLAGSLDKVLALQGVSFDFIKDETKRRQIGLIAQDVAPVVPEVVQDFIQPDEEPKLAIDYTRLVPLLVEAIKELTAKVAAMEARLPPEPLTA